jgi:hypothetical protein
MFFFAFGFIYLQYKLVNNPNGQWLTEKILFFFFKASFLKCPRLPGRCFSPFIHIEYPSIVNKFQKSTGWPGGTNDRSNFI